VSQESIELARRAYEAFNRGDLEGMVADFAPNFEFLTTRTIPGTRGVYRGAEGWTELVRWLRNEFESPRIEIRELIEAGDQVLASVTSRGRESRAAWKSAGRHGISGPCGTARSSTGEHLLAATRHSKPRVAGVAAATALRFEQAFRRALVRASLQTSRSGR
jgi:ketosteroid isomerase-like protein